MKTVAQKKEVKFTGQNLLGDEIEYTFELMPASVGVPLFHEEMLGIVGFCQQVKDYFNADEDDRNISEVSFAARNCFETKKLTELRDKLLKGVSASDPFEFYAALYHALMANYGATLSPLLEALKKQGEKKKKDTSQSETEASPSE